MRELKDHIVKGDTRENQLTIEVVDEPGAGGANHCYQITGFATQSNPSEPLMEIVLHMNSMTILFQNGPIKEAGVNGITQEALLAIVIDRLRSFQVGPYPSQENELAMLHCQLALNLLKMRTYDRLMRGVEGKTEA